MLKNLLILPDGTELFSGPEEQNAIGSVTLTACVNSGQELTIGSVCANMLEASLIAPSLTLAAGDQVTLYRVDDAGNRTLVGPFTLEMPTRPTATTMKLTGFDHVAKLDKDLTAWLAALDGWPYDLVTFAGMVCAACGLTFAVAQVPNGDFQVREWFKSGVTGRQIMGWLGQICCRFVRANADGAIEFGWYTAAQKAITPSGDPYYFAGGLSYETYRVSPVDAVQLRLADTADGALWPEAEEGANAYILSGNPILLGHVTEELLPYLEVIRTELSGVTYTPCKVSIPANPDITAGSIVNITDKNGVTITAYVMTKTTCGQRDTLECTGSPRRDSTAAVNNKTAAELAADLERYADSAAMQAVEGLSQEEVFNKLTDNGRLQGLFMKDGKLYINGEYIQIGDLSAMGATIGGWSISAGDISRTASSLSMVNTSEYYENVVQADGTIGVLSSVTAQSGYLKAALAEGGIVFTLLSPNDPAAEMMNVSVNSQGVLKDGKWLIRFGTGQAIIPILGADTVYGKTAYIEKLYASGLTGLGAPAGDTDAVPKSYADGLLALKTASTTVTIGGLSVPVTFVKRGKVVAMTLSAKATAALTAVQGGTMIQIPSGFEPSAGQVTGENTTVPLWGRGSYKPTLLGSLSLWSQTGVRIYWDTTSPTPTANWTIGAMMTWITNA